MEPTKDLETKDSKVDEGGVEETLNEIDGMLASLSEKAPDPMEDQEPVKIAESTTEDPRTGKTEVEAETTPEKVEPAVAPVVEPVAQEPIVETPAEPVDEVSVLRDDYEKKIASLRESLLQMTAAPAPTVQTESVKPTVVSREYVDDKTYDQVFSSREAFNNVLSTVEARAYERAQLDIAPIVERSVAYQIGVALKAEAFFSENRDLIPYRVYIGQVVRAMEGQHPEWDTMTLLENVEKEARARLFLTKQVPAGVVVQPASTTVPVNGGAGSRGVRTPVGRPPVTVRASGPSRDIRPKVSEMEEELAAIIPPGQNPFITR